jgi:asparagine synthase (glutamine-hydrolysing)
MCGFAGFFRNTNDAGPDDLTSTVLRMARTLRHRGPDDEGVWVNPQAGIALAFRRLSIVDLSPQGHQPMVSRDGRYVIAFNGEIYNHRKLRSQLEKAGVTGLRGHSDTEVLLEAIGAWGLETAVKLTVGMFAFAVWDCKERQLHLVRDRLGEKPIYYGWMGNTFLFGSEIKALRAFPGFQAEVDRFALREFLCYGYIPAPRSIFQGIFKLCPGMILSVDRTSWEHRPEPRAYWSLDESIENCRKIPFSESDAEAINHLEDLLREAVAEQMVADVPLGAFLSGGIDSSTIVALMQANSSRPIRTFTIGFAEEKYNEARFAKEVARHLGTDHTELYVTPEEAQAVIPKLPSMYDEPFADSSQIPTYLVSKLARQFVTVSLSGDGGDELFSGYSWYNRSLSLWNKMRWMPRPLRKAAGATLGMLSVDGWNHILRGIRSFPGMRIGEDGTGDKIHKLAAIIGHSNCPEDVYQCLVSKWATCSPALDEESNLVLQNGESTHRYRHADRSHRPNLDDIVDRLAYLDTMNYLPDNILTKVDRASMAVSLESRAPLLDHRVVEYAWHVPQRLKVRDGQGKWLLRQVLYRHLPRQLVDRPKMGFCVPIDSWIRGPMRDWAEALLDHQRLRNQGLLDPGPIRAKWSEHLTGRRNWQQHIWHVLMFQAWCDSVTESDHCSSSGGARSSPQNALD